MVDNSTYTIQEIHDYSVGEDGHVSADWSTSVGWVVKKMWEDEAGRRCTQYLTDPLSKGEAMVALMRFASGGTCVFVASSSPESNRQH